MCDVAQTQMRGSRFQVKEGYPAPFVKYYRIESDTALEGHSVKWNRDSCFPLAL